MFYLENVIGKDNKFWKYLVVAVVTFLSISIIGGIITVIVILPYILKAGVDVALSNPTDLVNALGIPLNVQLIIALI
ncbi:MAG: hypothetical protein LBQ70_03600, partial [Prevotellaceae bacterium]|nr:hypothetical protein [Prevotellaceae bacterium]